MVVRFLKPASFLWQRFGVSLLTNHRGVECWWCYSHFDFFLVWNIITAVSNCGMEVSTVVLCCSAAISASLILADQYVLSSTYTLCIYVWRTNTANQIMNQKLPDLLTWTYPGRSYRAHRQYVRWWRPGEWSTRKCGREDIEEYTVKFDNFPLRNISRERQF